MVTLKKTSLFVLFITSYIPLFILLILRQLKQNEDILHFNGINKDSILCFLENFWLTIILSLLSICGLIGVKILFYNLNRAIDNGDLVKIIDVENKNSETIAYISTYIVPFMFSDTKNTIDIISILIILFLIFLIYINTDMIIINPILNIKYSLYQIEYTRKSKKRKGLLISKKRYIEMDTEIKINQITRNIYYG